MIWIELTEESILNIKPVGINRVINLLMQQNMTNLNVGFFYYNRLIKEFLKLEKNNIKKKTINGIKNVSKNNKKPNTFIKKYIIYPFKEKITAIIRKKIIAIIKRRVLYKFYLNRYLNTGDKLLLLSPGWCYRGYEEKLEKIAIATKIKVVCMIYDLTPIYSPQFSKESHNKRFINWLIKVSCFTTLFLAISEMTKKDLIKFGNENQIKMPSIDVIRLGDNKVKVNNIINKDFILTVGTIQPRKNYTLLYYVWKNLIREKEKSNVNIPKLIIVGAKGWLSDDIYHLFVNDYEINKYVEIKTNCDDDELNRLYSECLFTIYPSLYEGWGLPVSESLIHGKVCLISADSAMEEIAPELTPTFNPYSTDSCMEKVLYYYNNRPALDALEKRIRKHFVPVLWDKVAKNILYKIEEI